MSARPTTSAEIRSAFVDYFVRQGHTHVPSSSLIPLNDPTLLFTSAGMVQFKDVFTGLEKRPYVRATTAQRCLRAGGKHNDLENVGFTGRHQTLFEMLGNFSFGDYFKKEAIHYAWDLVTNTFKMDKDRLYVTIHISDDEAFKIWTEQEKVPAERIFRFDKDNFWSAGDVGPCGPCSELFYNRGAPMSPEAVKKYLEDNSGDQVIEFYNLVFMQFERDANGEMRPLPKPSVDTGMGLERITSLLQNVDSNYATDIFQPILQAITAASTVDAKSLTGEKARDYRFATQVVADHLRAVSFLIADGLLPGNDGRSYVLRRILRRAVRFGKKLGFEKPFMRDLVPVLAKQLGSVYPELLEKQAFIQKAIGAEEEKFFSTLGKGLQLLTEAILTDYNQKVGGSEVDPKKAQAKKLTIPGQLAFLLYDSHGFPLDLTQVIAREFGFEVDEAGFEEQMARQRSLSKKEKTATAEDRLQLYKALDGRGLRSAFAGYKNGNLEGNLAAILTSEGEVDTITAKAEPISLELIFSDTPFYPEGGGQVGDHGAIFAGSEKVGNVTDVKKAYGELIAVQVELLPGQALSKNKKYRQVVDDSERRATAANHTATHLLHWALRDVLGTHVKQAGSLVNPELLRFDFTHFQALTTAEIQRLEDLVNEKIGRALAVDARLMSKDAAITAGAMALFGEKYGDEVRVLKIGDGFSTELCGGTHVTNTSEIRLFTIVSEAGVAAGTRRIIAHTADNAFRSLRSKATLMDQLRTGLKLASDLEVVERVERFQNQIKDLSQRLEKAEAQNAANAARGYVDQAEKVGQVMLVSQSVQASMATARTLVEQIRGLFASGVIAIGATDGDKAVLVVNVSKDLTAKINAGKLIQETSPLIGGKGGGKPEAAQAGGTNPAGITEALTKIRELVAKA